MSSRKSVRVRVVQSFDTCVEGDEATVERSPRVSALISAGVLQVIGDVPRDDVPAVSAPADGEPAGEQGAAGDDG